jgi:hypothetical protein
VCLTPFFAHEGKWFSWFSRPSFDVQLTSCLLIDPNAGRVESIIWKEEKIEKLIKQHKAWEKSYELELRHKQEKRVLDRTSLRELLGEEGYQGVSKPFKIIDDHEKRLDRTHLSRRRDAHKKEVKKLKAEIRDLKEPINRASHVQECFSDSKGQIDSYFDAYWKSDFRSMLFGETKTYWDQIIASQKRLADLHATQ